MKVVRNERIRDERMKAERWKNVDDPSQKEEDKERVRKRER